MKYIFVCLFAFLLIMPMVSAEVWTEYCCNSSYFCRNATIDINGSLLNLKNDIKCQFGCNSASPGCISVDYGENTAWWAFGMVMIGIGIYLAYIAFVEYSTRGESIYETEDE